MDQWIWERAVLLLCFPDELRQHFHLFFMRFGGNLPHQSFISFTVHAFNLLFSSFHLVDCAEGH